MSAGLGAPDAAGLGTGQPVVRLVTGIVGLLKTIGIACSGFLLAVLRTLKPILGMGGTVVVTRYDDVKEVFAADSVFGVPYAQKLDVIMGGLPFFLGMGDTPDYRRDTAAMREVVRLDDLAKLSDATLAAAERVVAEGNGRIDVVALVRKVTFEVLLAYFGTPVPAVGDLEVWATRLFEFQFADPMNDKALAAEVALYAPALRAHVQGLIEARRASGTTIDDVLGRCLAKQAEGRPDFTDDKIRCAMIGFIVGGLPQPPMVAPNAFDQLLRRPARLAEAQDAARAGDDGLLACYVFEAMRFDPLAPVLPRIVLQDHVLAAGTPRAKPVRAGANVMVGFSSAMMDERRVQDPRSFDPTRPPNNYIHFGDGLHKCFGLHINHALLPLMLKPLLCRHALARAAGAEGRLRKQFIFADRLVVTYR